MSKNFYPDLAPSSGGRAHHFVAHGQTDGDQDRNGRLTLSIKHFFSILSMSRPIIRFTGGFRVFLVGFATSLRQPTVLDHERQRVHILAH